MQGLKHYRNSKEPGVPLFVTTTVLDFVHAFRRPEIRDAMVRLLASECRRMQAALYGYAVMPHHLHLLVRPRDDMNGPQFMQVLKKKSGEAILPRLTLEERREFDQQRGLNGNTFWKYSYRSVVVRDEAMYEQKMHYIHQNPVLAGYVEAPEDYRWSSARLVMQDLLDRELGLSYEAVVRSVASRPGEGTDEPDS
jgi:putative transposase